MRVLVDGLQAANRSGTGVYTQRLVEALGNDFPDLEPFVVWPEGLPVPAVGGVTYIPGPARGVRRLKADQFDVPRLAKRLGAGLIHYPASVGGLLGASVSVVTVHDLSFLRHPEWFRGGRAAYYRWAVTRSARLACRIIADSRATADDLRELLGSPTDVVDVVHLGVDESLRPADEDARNRVRRKYGLPDRFFLYLGTLEPRKNVARIVAAWSRIAGECPDLHLVAAGRRGWKVEPILREILASRHADRIHLPDFVAPDDKAAVLSAAEAFVWPSLYEGFGLPPLEAMACGTPVLTSSTSSLPEVVGDAAVTVDPEDAEAIADGMRRLAMDGALREALRGRGQARAAGFTWRATAERTYEAYRRALME